MTLTEIAIKRPSLIVVIFATLSLMGILSYSTLSYELIPAFNAPIVIVTTVYPGASPNEVENTVSKKVEDAVSSLENIKRLNTQSFESLSAITVELANGTDVDAALRDAQRKVNQIQPLLPAGCKTPVISKFSSSDFPVMSIGSFSSLPASDFFQLIKDDIKPQLASIKGVAEVTIIGGEEKAVRVNIDQSALESRHISLLQVTQAINNANLDFPTGKVKGQEEQVRVRLAGKFENIEDLKDLVVAQFPNGGGNVKLREIAEVREDIKDVSTINRINGKGSVGIVIQKQRDANAVEVSAKVRARMTELEKRYAKENVKFDIASDSSEFTIKAADAVKHDMALAILLVALVILVFLHSLKDSFIVMLAIPASFITTLIAFYLFNFTFNLMTLLGLTLVVGILVDDSIVVLENIHRHLGMGKDKKTAALDGRNEIGFTALSITLVDVIVFLPIAVMNAGVISAILRQFAWVIVISTLISLFVSFTLTPLLASRISEEQELSKNTAWGRLHRWLELQIISFSNGYANVLRWCLGHKIIVLPLVTILFVASLSLAATGFIGSEFVNNGDQGQGIVKVELEKTATLEMTNQFSQRAEDILMGHPEVKKVFASVGGSSNTFEAGGAGQNKSEITVQLVPFAERKQSTDEFLGMMKQELIQKLPGAKVTTAGMFIGGGADQAPVQLVIMGENPDTLTAAAEKIKSLVKSVPGTSDVKLSVEAGVPEVKIEMDKEKMANLGLNVALVGGTLQNAFSGNDQSKFRKGSTEYDILVMLDGFNRKNVNDVKNISFVNQMGQVVHLSDFAVVVPSSGASGLQRANRRASVTLQSNVQGRDVGSISTEIDQKIAKANINKSITTAYIGDVEETKNAGAAIGLAFLISIILVYLLMVALYDNYVYPFVVLFAIPVAMIGAMLALALTKSNFSIFTMLGILVMNGLVCKNSILIVDFTNKLRADGYSVVDALVESVRERLRPILMTTLAMVLGMLPVATAHGAGAEWKNGLGWVLIGGLTSSMFLTVIVVPATYQLVESAGDFINRLRGKDKKEMKTDIKIPERV